LREARFDRPQALFEQRQHRSIRSRDFQGRDCGRTRQQDQQEQHAHRRTPERRRQVFAPLPFL
jgi:hypothetical protein